MQTNEIVRIGVIISTTRPERKGKVVANWFINQTKEYNQVNFEIIDLKEENLPFLNEKESPASGNYEHSHTKNWSQKISQYDGFVFIVAEYNNGPPAPLKNALDSIYHEWNKKPVVFVGYGTYGATRAVEQLVNITAKIGMVPLPKTFVGIIRAGDSISEDGSIDPNFVMGNIDGMINNLLWWAKSIATSINKTNSN